MKLNLYKKVKFFYLYKKIVKQNKNDLKRNFNLEVDRLQRLWTVISVPKENSDDIQKYGQSYIDNEVSKFIKNVDGYFRQIQIFEFIEIEDIKILNPLEVGVVFKYKFLKPQKIFWTKLIGILLIILIGILLIVIL